MSLAQLSTCTCKGGSVNWDFAQCMCGVFPSLEPARQIGLAWRVEGLHCFCSMLMGLPLPHLRLPHVIQSVPTASCPFVYGRKVQAGELYATYGECRYAGG